jgi:hypothetical protein
LSVRNLWIIVALLSLVPAVAGATELHATAKPGERFSVRNQNGEIWVKAWQENRILVRAEHSPDVSVRLAERNRIHFLEQYSRHGEEGYVDYRIYLPSWMPVQVEGVNSPVVIRGLKDGVRVETVNGSVEADEVGGDLDFASVNGDVRVRGARGRLRATSINRDVALEYVDGNVFGEAVNGDIILRTVTGDTIHTTTVRGDVYFSGTVRPRGRYYFSSHSGDVKVKLPKETDVRVESFVFSGDVITSIPAVEIQRDRSRRRPGRGQRYNFTLGKGDARLEMESFEGDVVLDWLENSRIR